MSTARTPTTGSPSSSGPLPIASGATHRPALAPGARIRPFKRLCPSRREAFELADFRPAAPASSEADRLRARQELRRNRGPDILTRQGDIGGSIGFISPEHIRQFQRNPRASRHLQRGRDLVLPSDRQVPLSRVRPAPAGLVPDDPPAPPAAPASLPPRRPRRPRANPAEGPAKTTERPLEIRRRNGQRPPRLQHPIKRRRSDAILSDRLAVLRHSCRTFRNLRHEPEASARRFPSNSACQKKLLVRRQRNVVYHSIGRSMTTQNAEQIAGTVPQVPDGAGGAAPRPPPARQARRVRRRPANVPARLFSPGRRAQPVSPRSWRPGCARSWRARWPTRSNTTIVTSVRSALSVRLKRGTGITGRAQRDDCLGSSTGAPIARTKATMSSWGERTQTRLKLHDRGLPSAPRGQSTSLVSRSMLQNPASSSSASISDSTISRQASMTRRCAPESRRRLATSPSRDFKVGERQQKPPNISEIRRTLGRLRSADHAHDLLANQVRWWNDQDTLDDLVRRKTRHTSHVDEMAILRLANLVQSMADPSATVRIRTAI